MCSTWKCGFNKNYCMLSIQGWRKSDAILRSLALTLISQFHVNWHSGSPKPGLITVQPVLKWRAPPRERQNSPHSRFWRNHKRRIWICVSAYLYQLCTWSGMNMLNIQYQSFFQILTCTRIIFTYLVNLTWKCDLPNHWCMRVPFPCWWCSCPLRYDVVRLQSHKYKERYHCICFVLFVNFWSTLVLFGDQGWSRTHCLKNMFWRT